MGFPLSSWRGGVGAGGRGRRRARVRGGGEPWRRRVRAAACRRAWDGEGVGVAEGRGLCGLRRVEPDHSLVPAGRRPPPPGAARRGSSPPLADVRRFLDGGRTCGDAAALRPPPRARLRLPRAGAHAPARLSARASMRDTGALDGSTVLAYLSTSASMSLPMSSTALGCSAVASSRWFPAAVVSSCCSMARARRALSVFPLACATCSSATWRLASFFFSLSGG